MNDLEERVRQVEQATARLETRLDKQDEALAEANRHAHNAGNRVQGALAGLQAELLPLKTLVQQIYESVSKLISDVSDIRGRLRSVEDWRSVEQGRREGVETAHRATWGRWQWVSLAAGLVVTLGAIVSGLAWAARIW